MVSTPTQIKTILTLNEQERRMTAETPPRGREAVRVALLEAAAHCFAEKGIAATSVREIAAYAQVNHGLVHRHFGSKETLLRTLLKQLAHNVDLRLESLYGTQELPPPTQLIPQIFAGTREVGLHWKVLLRALLEGITPDELQSDFPVFRRLVGSYRTLGCDEETALAEAALVFSTGLGFLTFQGYIERAVEQEGGHWETLRPKLMQRFLLKSLPDDEGPSS
jgi:TetR/AcrR family transcriptional regulator, repressor for neighboring sulfatase